MKPPQGDVVPAPGGEAREGREKNSRSRLLRRAPLPAQEVKPWGRRHSVAMLRVPEIAKCEVELKGNIVHSFCLVEYLVCAIRNAKGGLIDPYQLYINIFFIYIGVG